MITSSYAYIYENNENLKQITKDKWLDSWTEKETGQARNTLKLTYFFLSIFGISLFSAFSTITFQRKKENIHTSDHEL